MIRDINPLAQAALGTLFTWFLTALGAAVVIFFKGPQVSFVPVVKNLLGMDKSTELVMSYYCFLILKLNVIF